MIVVVGLGIVLSAVWGVHPGSDTIQRMRRLVQGWQGLGFAQADLQLSSAEFDHLALNHCVSQGLLRSVYAVSTM